MALKGLYNFKGLEISEAYLQVGGLNCHFYSNSNENLKTAAVYNSDGSLKTEAVYETIFTKNNEINANIKVFKDKATRDANPNSCITEFNFIFTGSLAATAKNHVKQAYEALKADDKYKDYTDV
jgi:hypothetical protein